MKYRALIARYGGSVDAPQWPGEASWAVAPETTGRSMADAARRYVEQLKSDFVAPGGRMGPMVVAVEGPLGVEGVPSRRFIEVKSKAVVRWSTKVVKAPPRRYTSFEGGRVYLVLRDTDARRIGRARAGSLPVVEMRIPWLDVAFTQAQFVCDAVDRVRSGQGGELSLRVGAGGRAARHFRGPNGFLDLLYYELEPKVEDRWTALSKIASTIPGVRELPLRIPVAAVRVGSPGELPPMRCAVTATSVLYVSPDGAELWGAL